MKRITRLLVERKSLGKTRGVKPIPYKLEGELGSLRELIQALVRHEVAEFETAIIAPVEADNTGIDAPNISPSLPRRTYSKTELAELLQTGRISFGYTYNNGKIDLDKAIAVACQAIEDGLVRIFINGIEIEGIDSELHLKDGDILTLIRLTFLSGQY